MAKTPVNREAPLEQGLRNYWYPLTSSAALKRRPRSLKVLGEELVLWRDAGGRPHLLHDRCPHRDARLSLGDVVDNQLACPYHAFQFNGAGQCVAIPTEGGACEATKRFAVRSYPVQEKVGLVWGYIGDVALFPPPPLALAEELEDPGWSGFVQPATWRANWLRVLDNLADPMHGPFLHGKSYTLGRGALQDQVRVVDLPDGFSIERAGQRGVNFDWVEFHSSGALWSRLDIPYPKTAGPGPALRIVGFVTPHDANRCTVYFFRWRQLEGWRRTLWRSLYKGFLEYNHWRVLEQDRLALETQRGIESRLHEKLVQSDVGVVRLRRFLQGELHRQQAVYAAASANGHAANGANGHLAESAEPAMAGEPVTATPG